jgi:hypothetical protein
MLDKLLSDIVSGEDKSLATSVRHNPTGKPLHEAAAPINEEVSEDDRFQLRKELKEIGDPAGVNLDVIIHPNIEDHGMYFVEIVGADPDAFDEEEFDNFKESIKEQVVDFFNRDGKKSNVETCEDCEFGFLISPKKDIRNKMAEGQEPSNEDKFNGLIEKLDEVKNEFALDISYDIDDQGEGVYFFDVVGYNGVDDFETETDKQNFEDKFQEVFERWCEENGFEADRSEDEDAPLAFWINSSTVDESRGPKVYTERESGSYDESIEIDGIRSRIGTIGNDVGVALRAYFFNNPNNIGNFTIEIRGEDFKGLDDSKKDEVAEKITALLTERYGNVVRLPNEMLTFKVSKKEQPQTDKVNEGSMIFGASDIDMNIVIPNFKIVPEKTSYDAAKKIAHIEVEPDDGNDASYTIPPHEGPVAVEVVKAGEGKKPAPIAESVEQVKKVDVILFGYKIHPDYVEKIGKDRLIKLLTNNKLTVKFDGEEMVAGHELDVKYDVYDMDNVMSKIQNEMKWEIARVIEFGLDMEEEAEDIYDMLPGLMFFI